MIDGLLGNSSLPALERSMQFMSARQKLLAGNIANVETPGFRPVDVNPRAFQTALQEALGSAKTALAANRRGLELGVLANIDVLNAQKQVSQTERDLARARYETLLALLKLKAASGRLGESDVVEVNALLGA